MMRAAACLVNNIQETMTHSRTVIVSAAVVALVTAAPGRAQVDQARAASYFREAAALCAADSGKLWGVSLCGPIVIADPATGTIATSEPAPAAQRPAALGFANAAMEWGGTRWTTLVWQFVPTDAHARGRLLVHELFHRVQPQLKLFVRDVPNDHLDTEDGRFWMQLEWRALARALKTNDAGRRTALADALAFRAARRAVFAGAAESERLLEIQEGLAQYTGTVVASGSHLVAIADAIDQLERAAGTPTFVRTFAYPSGAAYGLLLDEYAPGWTRRISPADDLGALVGTASGISAAAGANERAAAYGGSELRATERTREVQRQARIAELRRKFVDGPVLIVPFASGAAFTTTGMTPLPGVGTIYPGYRVTAEWGSLQADQALVVTDPRMVVLTAPTKSEGSTLTGDGWSLTRAAGWAVRPGARTGDLQLIKER